LILNKLEIEGYGPFIEKTEIDFSLLNFFSIQGENGSGKSTLIDAIYYALWGESFKARSFSDLIPKEAERTRVFLDFDMEGRNIRIERLRLNQKSNYVMKVRSGGEEETFSKARDIVDYLEEIGLKKSFLTRAFLIQQGKFEEILESGKREDRDVILQMSVGPVFREIRDEITRKREEIGVVLQSREMSLEGFDEEKNAEILEEINPGIEKVKKKMKSLQDKIRSLRKDKEKYHQDIKEYENYLKTVEERQEYLEEKEKREIEKTKLEKSLRAIELVPQWKRINQVRKEKLEKEKLVGEQSTKLKALDKEFKEIEKKTEHLEKSLQEKKEKFREFYPRVNHLSQEVRVKRGEWHRIQAEAEKRKKRKVDFGKKLTEIASSLKKKREEWELIEKQEKRDPFSREKLENLKKFQKTYFEYLESEKNLKKKRVEIKALESEIGKHEKFLEEEAKQILLLDEKIRKERKALRNYLALTLRKELNPGDECPVCGGTYHEKSHEQQINEPSRELEAMERDREKIQQEINRKKGLLDHQKQRLVTLSRETAQEEAFYREKENLLRETFSGFPFNLAEALEKEEKREKQFFSLEEQKRTLQISIKTLEEKQEEMEREAGELETELKDFSKEQEDIRQQGEKLAEEIRLLLEKMGISGPDPRKTGELLEAFQREMEEEEKLLKSREIQFREIESEMEKTAFRKEEGERVIREKAEFLKENEGDFAARLTESEIGEEDIRNAEGQSLRSIQEKIRQNHQFFSDLKRLNEKTEREESKLEHWKEIHNKHEAAQEDLGNLEKENEELMKESFELEHRKKEMEKQRKRYEETRKKIQKIKKEYRVYQELENDFRSNQFPAFYARMVLEKIVFEANNSFLSRVLNGRYALQMDEEKDRFLVYDQEQGHVRPTDTLSGGEKFLASFALALSFSRLAGEKIGIFFIDEGFGTLDENNRQILKDIFDVLGTERTRKIGLITHIPEIAESVSQKIKVFKSEIGSRVEVHF
jgi:exonuclease SbcC